LQLSRRGTKKQLDLIMRSRTLGLLLLLLVLATAPGCRALATAGVVAGGLALEWAVSGLEEEPRCDHHAPEPPMRRCR
jgi:hypothetical protein